MALRILLTGGSSLTGFWFAKELAEAGHSVTAILTRADISAYTEEPRNQRVEQLLQFASPMWNCYFGDEQFLQALASLQFDVLCHHGANVTDYKSPDFDPTTALSTNTNNIVAVMRLLHERTVPIILSGSVFEANEGVSSGDGDAISPYGLSKWFTSELVRFYAAQYKVCVGKFVISNPFGPFEEARFTRYLIREWFSGNMAVVNTPHYVRDNIFVGLLAKAYQYFVERVCVERRSFSKCNPSGYVESQRAFAERVAREMRPRLQLPCELLIGEQTTFGEPLLRVNTENARLLCPAWSEVQAWNEFAAYYALLYKSL
jgi:UDP-glucose 4-epimerase